MSLNVRPFQAKDLSSIVDYFYLSSAEHIAGMGADKSKLPPREEWLGYLEYQFKLPNEQKDNFYVLWELDGQAIGHSNVNQIQFGAHAFMHLHLWKNPNRRKGLGSAFVLRSLPYYFDTFKIKTLFCEPFAENPAPNRTLAKLGFEFEKSYETTPGKINFHQTVNRWRLSREKFEALI